MTVNTPVLNLEDEIERLKKERNAVVLAHYYQESEVQDVADFIGDSLQLSQAAAKTKADVICFAGVHFMAETAKILNPGRVVVLPDLDAGCSLANGCPADRFAAWIARYPGAVVVSYINCSAEVKALSDYIVTSSNAEKIVRTIPEDKTVLFAPDKNLGRYIEKRTGRKMVLWQGTCVVHETFSLRKLVGLKERHPRALVIAHPECEEPVLADGRLHRIDDRAPQLRGLEPSVRVHRGHRAGHPAPDAETGRPQDLHCCPPGGELCLQRLPVHEDEHAGKGPRVAPRPDAANRDGAGPHGPGAPSDPANAGPQLAEQ